jgi:hypothetical protein
MCFVCSKRVMRYTTYRRQLTSHFKNEVHFDEKDEYDEKIDKNSRSLDELDNENMRTMVWRDK